MRQLLRWAILLALSIQAVAGAARPQLRGIWMHATQIKTPAAADAVVAKIDKANLNAVFVLVWYWGGQAFFQSDLAPMGDGVQPGYDPLAYLVKQCHKRKIQVHAWFVNGAYGAAQPRHVLDKHPDYAVDDGGAGTLWYDFGKPQVRSFQSDLMLECLRKYKIDGLHFDYIRYGPTQCYCAHCQREFSKRYGFEPITWQSRSTFPAAASLSGNPLAQPTTATVLAEFSDGTPAIALNKLGSGSVLLLNWHAEKDMPPPVAETVKIVFGMWIAGKGKVHIATTPATKTAYGTSSVSAAQIALTRLGHRPNPLLPQRIASLPSTDVLVLPAVYIISSQTAQDIETFVKKGGNALIIDGPVRSMQHKALQRVTGFARPGRHFNRDEVIRSTGRSPLLPRGKHRTDPQREKLRAQKWVEFRQEGITQLVRDVYRRAKEARPKTQVTAAVFSSPDSARKACQDWPRWLREGTIDYVIPMAYTEDNATLGREIAQWKTIDPQLSRIIPGLSIYQRRNGKAMTRDLGLIRSQHQLCLKQGAHGNVYFSFPYLNDPLVGVSRKELYPKSARVYTPPRR